jgi:hypothetical protein
MKGEFILRKYSKGLRETQKGWPLVIPILRKTSNF